jgi:hypothetical protein
MPWRSAITGEYVEDEYAKAHPDTTVWENEGEKLPLEDTRPATTGDKTDEPTGQPEQDDTKLAQEGG